MEFTLFEWLEAVGHAGEGAPHASTGEAHRASTSRGAASLAEHHGTPLRATWANSVRRSEGLYSVGLHEVLGCET